METPPAAVFRDLTVERFEREDGRYILYYRWPEHDAAPDAALPDPSDEPEPDV